MIKADCKIYSNEVLRFMQLQRTIMGRTKYRNMMVEGLIPWAVKLAGRLHFPTQQVSHEDAVSAALEGCIEAVDKWNPDAAALTTFATFVIRTKISLLRRQVAKQCCHGKFVDWSAADHDFDTLSDSRSPEVVPLEDREMFERVSKAVAQLPSRTQEMIKRRYEDGVILSDIGREFRVTRERVRQIIDGSLNRVRGAIEGRKPIAYTHAAINRPEPQEGKRKRRSREITNAEVATIISQTGPVCMKDLVDASGLSPRRILSAVLELVEGGVLQRERVLIRSSNPQFQSASWGYLYSLAGGP